MTKVKEMGWIEKGTGKHQSNIVYSMDGLCPTIPASTGFKEPPKMFLEGVSNEQQINAERERVPIKDSTKKGYSYAEDGDGIDLGLNRKNHRGTVKKQISHTIKTEIDCGVIEIDKPKRLFNIYNENYGTGFAGNVWDENHIAPGLMTMQGGNREPMVIASTQEHASRRDDGICPTLTETMGTGGNNVPMHNKEVRIRKLTPRETWRLMGFSDSDFDKASQVNSDTQLYKQAGNSIVVNVLMDLFKEML